MDMNKIKMALLIIVLGCFFDIGLASDNSSSEQEESKTTQTEQVASPMVEAGEERAEFPQVSEASEQVSEETTPEIAPESVEETPTETVNEETNVNEEQSEQS